MKSHKQLLMIGLVLVLLAGAALIVRRLRSPGVGSRPLEFDECLGAKLADETVKLVNSGDLVAVNVPGNNPVAKARMKGFESVLKGHPGLRIAAVEWTKNEQEILKPEGFAPALLSRLLTQYPDAKAIVWFYGVPQMGPQPGVTLPTMVALSMGELEQWQITPAVVIRDKNRLAHQPVANSENCADYVVANGGSSAPAK